jgi:hypothetical protein
LTFAVDTTVPATPAATAKKGSKIFISTSDTSSPDSSDSVCEMAPKGPRVPATGRPAVNSNIFEASSSPPGTIFWKPQKNGLERNASTLA